MHDQRNTKIFSDTHTELEQSDFNPCSW